MNKRILACLSVVTTIALTSCSDSDGSSGVGSSVSVPSIEGAPAKSTLDANNKVAASPAEVAADLETLAEMDEMGDLLGNIELSPSSLPIFGLSGAVKQNVSLARKNIVAWGECQDMPNMDTTFVEDGFTMKQTMKVLDSKGAALQICQPETNEEAQSMMDKLDGMQMVMHMTGTSDSVDMEMNMKMVVNMEGSGQSAKIGMQAKANFLIDVKLPKAFNVYMELDMNMAAMNTDSEEEPDMDFSMTMWFQNGRYKCEVDYDVLENEVVNSKVCDLVNAGTVVGSLWNDYDGDMQVKDASGSVVDP